MSQAIDASTRFALHQRARDVLGEQEGDTLMAHLPPVGWADVATKQDIEALRVATKQDIESLRKDMVVSRAELKAYVERGFRRQTTWVTTVFAAQSALFAGLVIWLVERLAA